jgi:hypothetical protein
MAENEIRQRDIQGISGLKYHEKTILTGILLLFMPFLS